MGCCEDELHALRTDDLIANVLPRPCCYWLCSSFDCKSTLHLNSATGAKDDPSGMPRKQPRTLASTQSKTLWRKAIPQPRDRLQSRLLVWLLAPVLFGLVLQALTFALAQGRPVRILFAEALGISLVFAFVVWRVKAATAPAALCGGVICLLITFYSGSPRLGPVHSGLTPLIELFILTFAATRAGRRHKQSAGLAETSPRPLRLPGPRQPRRRRSPLLRRSEHSSSALPPPNSPTASSSSPSPSPSCS